MKIRSGFVSNSSSSSFLIFSPKEVETKQDILEYIADNWAYEDDIKTYLNAKHALTLVNKLKKHLTKNEEHLLKEMIEKYCYKSDAYYFSFMGENEQVEFEYTPRYQIENALYDAYLKGKGKELKFDEKSYPIDYEYRTMYKIDNWQEDLKNHKGFIYKRLRYNILHDLEYNISLNDECMIPINQPLNRYNIPDNILDKRTKIVDYIVEQEIEKILSEYGQHTVYLIGFCTDGGDTTQIDYVGRRGKIFKDCDYVIR